MLLSTNLLCPFLTMAEVQQLGVSHRRLYDIMNQHFWLVQLRRMLNDFSVSTDCFLSGQILTNLVMGQTFAMERVNDCEDESRDVRYFRSSKPIPKRGERRTTPWWWWHLCGRGHTRKYFVYRAGDRLVRYIENVFYFEIRLHSGSGSAPPSPERFMLPPVLVVGLQTISIENKNYYYQHSDFLAGWSEDSIAYHSDDGSIQHSGLNVFDTEEFGPGAVVGCGIDYATDSVFFTKNGRLLYKKWFSLINDDRLFPVINHDHKDWAFTANFGTEPFSFDLETLFSSE